MIAVVSVGGRSGLGWSVGSGGSVAGFAFWFWSWGRALVRVVGGLVWRGRVWWFAIID